MNKHEFIQTLALGLNFIQEEQLKAIKQQASSLYEEVNIDSKGNLSFLNYQQFLKAYLGSQSPMSINPTQKINQLSESQQIIPSEKQITIKNQQGSIIDHSPLKSNVQNTKNVVELLLNKDINAYSYVNMNSTSKFESSLDQFHELIYNEIYSKCINYDKDGDGFLFRKQFQSFLYDVLELEYNSINFISNNYFHFVKKNTIAVQQFIQIVCQIHFREIFINIVKMEMRQTLSQRCIMSLTYFVERITENCFFFYNKPSFRLLERVFEQLIAKSENPYRRQITLQDFNSFILKYCCSNKLKLRHPPTTKTGKNLKNPPVSIAQVENSNYQQDQSQNNDKKGPQSIQQINSRRSHARSIKQISQQHNKSHIKQAQKPYNYLIETIYTRKQQSQTSENKQIKQKQNKKQSYQQNQQNQQNQQQQQSNFTKMEIEPIAKSYFSLKQQLWLKLQNLFLKYSIKNKKYLTFQQFQILNKKESIFMNKQKLIKNIQKLNKKQYLQIQMLIKYYIHFTGEQALINFNKNQIKGKSFINIHQISQILYIAFNNILQNQKQNYKQYVQTYLIQQKSKDWHYKDYLQYICRNLSIKNIQ